MDARLSNKLTNSVGTQFKFLGEEESERKKNLLSQRLIVHLISGSFQAGRKLKKLKVSLGAAQRRETLLLCDIVGFFEFLFHWQPTKEVFTNF